MKLLPKIFLAGAAAFALLQLFRPGIPAKPAAAELQVPPNIQHILQKDCYSCHSNQRRLLWFDQIVPAYWLVRHDIVIARLHLNFSTLGAKPPAVQKASLYEAVNMMQLGAMPLPEFTALHPDARVTPEDLAALKAYLAPWPPLSSAPAAGQNNGAVSPPVSLADVQPEWNGLHFEPDFESWKLISTTDRGDNNTLRLVLGNDIAAKAARSGNISPWPNGARFAKIAWQQQQGTDGLVHPGDFVQVEFMVKDTDHYRSTDGWGWGRWRSLALRPYGENARFVNECTGCHRPVRGDDYVYTLPIAPSAVARDEVVNTNAAALPESLPWQPLGWSAITLYVDRGNRTTAVLFANSAAMSAVHARGVASGGSAEPPPYPVGAVLALVTWAQRDDPHWFGARIPNEPLSVEFVEVHAQAQTNGYRHFAGPNLREDSPARNATAERLHFILNLPPARLP
jgi:hypothetical protein